MPNPDYAEAGMNEKPKSAKPKTRKGGGEPAFNERTAGWGALPGKAQRGNRSGGTKKCPIYPKSTGL